MFRPGSVQLARIFGIRIGVNASWFLFLFILVYWLSDEFSRQLASHTQAYVLAAVSALAFFASLIIHELGHALAARREGIEILGIDLWFFGGMARMNRLPQTPGAEFKVAAAGPLASLIVLGACTVAGAAVGGWTHFANVASYTPGVRASPVLVGLGWLVAINTLILVFNLVPAQPLDGGRIAQAIAWRVTGDRNRATRASGRLGQGFAFVVAGFALWLLGTGSVGAGVWFLLIAMVIAQGARGALLQSAVSERLETTTVGQIMNANPVTIPAHTPLLAVQDEYFNRHRWPWLAVVDETGHFLGLLRQARLEEELAAGRPALAAQEALEEGQGRWQIALDAPLQTLLASEGLRMLGGVAAVDTQGILRGVVTLAEVQRALGGAPEAERRPGAI